MKIISINVSLPKAISDKGKPVSTGIFKEPVKESVLVKKLNLEGDQQADLKFHGGVCKAVYAYPFKHYVHWERVLNRKDFVFGQFGENLTIDGLTENDVYIGDTLRVGSALFEVTQPRVPCFKLGIRMGGLNEFPKSFLTSGLVGFYLRVLEEGSIAEGDDVEHRRVDSNSLSISEIHHAMHFDKNNISLAKKALEIEALPPGWCKAFEKRLAAAGEPFEVRVHPLASECCSGL